MKNKLWQTAVYAVVLKACETLDSVCMDVPSETQTACQEN